MLKFFDWAYANGDKMALDLDYVPMPAAVVKLIQDTWRAQIKDASGNAGLEVGTHCARHMTNPVQAIEPAASTNLTMPTFHARQVQRQAVLDLLFRNLTRLAAAVLVLLVLTGIMVSL